jgi:PhzF family phenazine biosynthesis protein
MGKNSMTKLSYRYVDVFAAGPDSGNSLPVFIDPPVTKTHQLLAITQALRQFESVFVWPTENPQRWTTRVFDLAEELPFAGHPMLGAAAALHERAGVNQPLTWDMILPNRTVNVTTQPASAGAWTASLAQGDAEFGGTWNVTDDLPARVAAAHSLNINMLRADLPLRVISTELRYLIIPVLAEGLASARIKHDLTTLLASIGAQFAVLLDVAALEARHWTNDGSLEDVATGSAAGTIAAYMRSLTLIPASTPIILHQGRFTGRPSELVIEASGSGTRITHVTVGGLIRAIRTGELDT